MTPDEKLRSILSRNPNAGKRLLGDIEHEYSALGERPEKPTRRLIAINGRTSNDAHPRPILDGPLSGEELFQIGLDDEHLEYQIDEWRGESGLDLEPSEFRVQEETEPYQPARRYAKAIAAASVALFMVLVPAGNSYAPAPVVAATHQESLQVDKESLTPATTTEDPSSVPLLYDPGFIIDLEPDRDTPQADKQSALHQKTETV